jgi:hypothetical protein
MKPKEKFLKLKTFVAKNGKNVKFWEDRWLGNFTLQNRFPYLYCIVRRKNDSVASVMSSVQLDVSFRKGLEGRNLVAWHNLVALLTNVTLDEARDIFTWDLHQNKKILGPFNV